MILRQTEEFTISGEFLWFGVILHADVHAVWTKGVKRNFRKALQDVVLKMDGPCYAFQTPSHDPKKRKFIQAVGGVFHHYRFTPDGEKAEMYLFRPLDWSKGKQHGITLQIEDEGHQGPV